MLIEFSVGNFRSFKETVTFSMVAANLQSQDKAVDENNTFAVNDKLRLLKSAAIYGANASGKTNLGKAMQFMWHFIQSSSKDTQADEPIDVDVYRLSETTLHEPAFFQLVFIQDGVQYRYGFEVTAERVVSEWLFSLASKKESNLFQRDQDGIHVGVKFKEGKGLEERTRENALFLSVAAQFNGGTARQMFAWFHSFGIIFSLDYEYNTRWSAGPDSFQMFADNTHTSEMREIIKNLDVGIEDVAISKKEVSVAELSPDTPQYVRRLLSRLGTVEALTLDTTHRRFGDDLPTSDVVFNLSQESAGTQKLVHICGPIINALKLGQVLFVDELDARLHPLMTCAIVGLFNSRDKNPNNAQLIFATHDTNLLSKDLFRRDQIWFAEKNRQGATHLYSLAEFRVRNDRSSLESDYIQGKFGAIPFIGDFSRVFGSSEADSGAEK